MAENEKKKSSYISGKESRRITRFNRRVTKKLEKERADAVEASATGKTVGRLPPDRHTALLCALKPYLGSERRQAVEYLISVCRVWGTLQSVGLTLPALLSPEQGKGTPSGDKEV